MPRLRAALFDNDGTIVDTNELIMDCFRAATGAVLGAPLPDEVLSAKIGQPLVVQVRDFAPDEPTQRRILEEYRRASAAVDDQVQAFPGMVELLSRLCREGMATGVVTSKMHAAAERGLRQTGAWPFLSCLVSPDDCPLHKPDPAPVLQGCLLLGVEPEACAYVGDSPFDMQAGNAAGCVSVAVTWGMFPEEALLAESPAHVCRTPDELEALLVR